MKRIDKCKAIAYTFRIKKTSRATILIFQDAIFFRKYRTSDRHRLFLEIFLQF